MSEIVSYMSPQLTVPLKDFVSRIKDELTPQERQTIIDQAILVLNSFYAHLEQKTVRYGCAPIKRLERLRNKSELLSEIEFHREMLGIFSELRDRHTGYTLPTPFKGCTAFLPILIEPCKIGGQTRFIVSKTSNKFGEIEEAEIYPGIEVTHWNGIPISRAVELNADKEPGSNNAARLARGLHRLTIRPLAFCMLPDESWVDLTLITPRGERMVRLEWQVHLPEGRASSLFGGGLGIDPQVSEINSMRTELFASRDEGQWGDALAWKTIRTSHGEYGYIRIFKFSESSVGSEFTKEVIVQFRKILANLPRTGLVIDVRGNPGGYIVAAERILQLFSPKEIEVPPFQLPSSKLAHKLCTDSPPAALDPDLRPLSDWAESISSQLTIGEQHSRGLSIGNSSSHAPVEQQYFGPVILVVDGNSYSAAGMFIAGFRDNSLGPILGTDDNIGAGGANVFGHQFLASLFLNQEPFTELPREAGLRVAIRRSLRVGELQGQPLEDFGVFPDHIHQMTLDDILNKNTDLLERATEILKTQSREATWIEVKELPEDKLRVLCPGLDRLDIYVNERPWSSLDVDGTEAIVHPQMSGSIRILGFRKGMLRASIVRNRSKS